MVIENIYLHLLPNQQKPIEIHNILFSEFYEIWVFLCTDYLNFLEGAYFCKVHFVKHVFFLISRLSVSLGLFLA